MKKASTLHYRQVSLLESKKKLSFYQKHTLQCKSAPGKTCFYVKFSVVGRYVQVTQVPTLNNITFRRYIFNNVTQVNRTTAKTNPLKLIYEDYKQSYTDLTVLRWSVWHIIGMATYVQVEYVLVNFYLFFFFLLNYPQFFPAAVIFDPFFSAQVFLYVNILYTYVADASADGKHALLNGAVDSLATVFGQYYYLLLYYNNCLKNV